MCLFGLRLELFCCLMDANFKLKYFTQIVCKYMEFLGIIYMHFTFKEKPFQCSTAFASQNACASVSQFGLFCYHFHWLWLHRSHSRFACRSLFTVRINLRIEKNQIKQMQRPNENFSKWRRRKNRQQTHPHYGNAFSVMVMSWFGISSSLGIFFYIFAQDFSVQWMSFVDCSVATSNEPNVFQLDMLSFHPNKIAGCVCILLYFSFIRSHCISLRFDSNRIFNAFLFQLQRLCSLVVVGALLFAAVFCKWIFLHR